MDRPASGALNVGTSLIRNCYDPAFCGGSFLNFWYCAPQDGAVRLPLGRVFLINSSSQGQNLALDGLICDARVGTNQSRPSEE